MERQMGTILTPYEPADSKVIRDAQVQLYELAPGTYTIRTVIASALAANPVTFDFGSISPLASPDDIFNLSITPKPCGGLTAAGDTVSADFVTVNGEDLSQYIDAEEGGIAMDAPVVVPDGGCSLVNLCLRRCLTKAFLADPPPNSPPAIVPGADLPNQPGMQGSPIPPIETAAKFTDADGTIVAYQMTGAPDGVSINPVTGQITGTPTEIGVFNVVVRAIDDAGASVDCPFVWTIDPAGSNVALLKAAPAAGAYAVDDVLVFPLTISNTGSTELTNIVVNATAPDVVIGTVPTSVAAGATKHRFAD